MGASRYWRIAILAATILALAGCAGNRPEVEAAKADYIQAKARLIEAQAQKVEQEAATTALQRELAHSNAQLAAELRRQRQQVLLEIGRVMILVGLSLGSAIALLYSIRSVIRIWTEQRARLLQNEVQALTQRIRWTELEKSRLEHERLLHETRAQIEIERQKTTRLQAELAQIQGQAAREQRWLEYIRRAREAPLANGANGENGRGWCDSADSYAQKSHTPIRPD